MGKIVGVIGDSTFLHGGVAPLMDLAYNKSYATIIIVDNRTTGMTGSQEHPGTGRTLDHEPTNKVILEDLARAQMSARLGEARQLAIERVKKLPHQQYPQTPIHLVRGKQHTCDDFGKETPNG